MVYSYDRRRFARVSRALRRAADEVFEGLPVSLQGSVQHYLFGVYTDKAQPLEAHADELYEFYEPVRKLLRSQYGASVSLYRGEPKDKPPVKRRFLSWTPEYELAAHFAKKKKYEVVEADVRVSDVCAVLMSPHNPDYVEFLVKDRPEYHEKGQPLPLVGVFEHYFAQRGDPEFRTNGYTYERAESMLQTLERAVDAAGGKILSVEFDEPELHLVAEVQLPPTVVRRDDLANPDDYYVADLGSGVVIHYLSPRLVAPSKQMWRPTPPPPRPKGHVFDVKFWRSFSDPVRLDVVWFQPGSEAHAFEEATFDDGSTDHGVVALCGEPFARRAMGGRARESAPKCAECEAIARHTTAWVQA